jgi:peptidylprolyl isomerase
MRARLVPWLFLAACGGAPSNSPADMAQPAVQGKCVPAGYEGVPYVTAAPVRSFAAAEQTLVAGRDYVAILDTDQGCLVLDLHEAETPITSNSFVFLALRHYFDGIAFHRVIDGFMAQTGDPNTVEGAVSTWGKGGPGYAFGLEVTPGLNYDRAGVVGMARTSDPDSNGSQFFITFDAAHNLDQQYTVFASVIAGLDVLPRIERGEPPGTPTRITSASIASK